MPRSKSKPPPTKVLIVDDHPAVREALAIRIAKLPDLVVCGEAADQSEALQLVAEKNPDIAIIDISLRQGNGLDLIKRIKAKSEKVRMLVWSMHGESLYAERALRAGAMGYITKEQAMGQMIVAIRQVAAGKVYLSPGMTQKILHYKVGTSGSITDRSPVDVLSDREIEVFRLIGHGVKTTEIAARLHLSVGSIWTYRDRIREKLDLSDGTELVHYATQWVLNNG
jgi:DNA-binding NarL/FixJ family response regulator